MITTEWERNRHVEWLKRELARRTNPSTSPPDAGSTTIEFSQGSPTYVVRIANATRDHLPYIVADAIGSNGASISFGYGIWEGNVEPDAAITIQCTEPVLYALVAALKTYYPGEDFLHVERHDVPTAYVDQR